MRPTPTQPFLDEVRSSLRREGQLTFSKRVGLAAPDQNPQRSVSATCEVTHGRRTLEELLKVPEGEMFEDDDILDLMIENYSNEETDNDEKAFMVGALRIFKRSNPNRPAELHRRMRRLRGYRKRAEGRRRRAFEGRMKTSMQ